MKTDYIELYTDYFCEYLQEIDLKNSFEIDAIARVGRGYARLGDEILAPEFL